MLASKRAMLTPFPSADLSLQIQIFPVVSCMAWNLQPFQNLRPGFIQVRRPVLIHTGATRISQRRAWELDLQDQSKELMLQYLYTIMSLPLFTSLKSTASVFNMFWLKLPFRPLHSFSLWLAPCLCSCLDCGLACEMKHQRCPLAFVCVSLQLQQKMLTA
mmetsp:Transcript_79423/g.140184  ORF Transcript_79423/g.140184 Transcript_79423/m.140184 type:complete len:160 (-) Transcript_79423:67-546(-)